MLRNLLRRIRKPNENSKGFQFEMAARADGKHIRYVTERVDNVDNIIGREGSLNVRDEYFIVLADGAILFRGYIPELKISELLSLDGLIISGPDQSSGGTERTIIAYYKYYR